MTEQAVWGQAVQGGVALLRDAVDALLAARIDGATSAELLSAFTEIEVQRNRLAAVDQQLIAALGRSGAVLDSGSTSLPDLVSSVARCSRAQARARVGRSVDLGPRRAVSGELLEPIHPALAAAVSDGAVSEAQCQVIVSALGRIGPDAEPQAFEVAEQFLIEAARAQPPSALAASARWVLAQLDPAGLEPAETTAERRRAFSLSNQVDADGLVAGRARFTPETAAALRAVLDVLAAPRPADEAGERDDRGAEQRRHDALLEMVLRLLRSGDLPDSGGVAAAVVVQLNDLAPGRASDPDGPSEASEATPGVGDRLLARLSGVGVAGDSGPVSLNRLRPLIDECEITTVVLSASGGVLDYGRERRIATPAMRRALAARDGGCCFPGCDRPPAWSEAHHVWAWLDGGPTCLDNLCLLCAYHHRSFAAAGWQVIMRDGIPVWIPPAWLDSAQREVRNTARHLPEIHFGQIGAGRELLRT